ncbi:hypothetical protein D3C80_1771270 [compost metagenome]
MASPDERLARLRADVVQPLMPGRGKMRLLTAVLGLDVQQVFERRGVLADDRVRVGNVDRRFHGSLLSAARMRPAGGRR